MAQTTFSIIASSCQICFSRIPSPTAVVGKVALAPRWRTLCKPRICCTQKSDIQRNEDSGVTFLKPSQGPGEKFLVKKNPPVLVCPATTTNSGFYYLSGLDHNVMHPIEGIYSYKVSGMESTDNCCEVIKKSLAEILVHFYPLAGKLVMTDRGKYMVDCTGEGVYFVEAFVEQDLDKLGDISIPNAVKIQPLLHFHEADNILDLPLLTLQVTRFKCGGIVIGLRFNHCMGDEASMHHFMTSWAEIARGLPLSVPPFLDRSIMKPRQFSEAELSSYLSDEFDGLFYEDYELSGAVLQDTDEKVCMLVHLGPQKMMELERTLEEEEVLTMPTKLELATAFLWREIVRSTKVEEGQRSKILHHIDLRTKLGAGIPKGYFGNGIGVAYNGFSTEEQLVESSLCAIVEMVQVTIQTATTDYLQAFFSCIEAKGLRVSYKNGLLFTNLSPYKADFGWGDPEQVQILNLRHNVVYFLPQKEKEMKGSVTALIVLPPTAMDIFQKSIC